MNRIDIINAGWNCYNGYYFDLLRLELWKPINIDNCLFGIAFSKKFLYVDILFFTITIFDNTGFNK